MSNHYDDALSRLRQEAEDRKSPADRLRDRLAYAKKLRSNADAARRVAERMNTWMQRPDADAPKLQWWPFRRAFAIIIGPHTLTLDQQEAQSIFTWCMDHERAVRANADRLEAEISGTP